MIEAARHQDHDAFDLIYGEYHTQIYNYILRLMGNSEDAYDMTQDVFLKAYLALPRTSADLKLGAWLYRIATNVCLDELRHRKLIKWQPWDAFVSVFSAITVADDGPEREVLREETGQELQLAMTALLPQYRMVLILREYEELTYEEIAEVLNTTRRAVSSQLFRAREALRHLLSAYPYISGGETQPPTTRTGGAV